MIQSEALSLLEWSRLCQHLSTFAATKLGAIAARQLTLPVSQTESEQLLAATTEAYQIDQHPPGLKFTGIRDIGDALERARRQGLLQPPELLDIATTLAGARQLRRAIDGFEADERMLRRLRLARLVRLRERRLELLRGVDQLLLARRTLDRVSHAVGYAEQ